MVFGGEVAEQIGLINGGFLFLFNERDILFSGELATSRLVIVGHISGAGIGCAFRVFI